MKSRCFRLWFVSSLMLVSSALAGAPASRPTTFTLWQLPNQTHSQMLSYVLRTTGGKLVVIDGGTTGDAAYLKGFLAALGNEVEVWFISHPHSDHVEAITAILNDPANQVRVKTFYASLPDLDWIRKHCPAEDTKSTADLLDALKKAGHKLVDVPLGAEYKIDDLRIEVLAVRNPELTHGGLNNSTMVIRVEDAGKSVLFLGDLGSKAGQKLLGSPYGKRVHADYVQMAHHGQQGVDETFYKAVGAKYCLWPTPRWLYENDSGKGRGSGHWDTLNVREWMSKLGIKKHYLMIDGLQRID